MNSYFVKSPAVPIMESKFMPAGNELTQQSDLVL